ncbi:uncharacterized protein LACBIDRAFT_334617 [Laccaria bicolor S238N-H82]|uniref:Predicted protein n=1 Tax=Laccaria bicolor (strain S238N-H82 / ATCC MYA-4686) TaxID=486041 RepID=B0DZR1_LACBS|nr:uncharacterized protein LACBIDRAFT_334617 [Laccaria bicolor S238N-H82]EDQ99920.1 predicted protein [Laccaria bicolor S238N-H82]|eukprot:XP_001889463.1 predicted protein [Laccaria bicolor S238N-H82]
MSLSQNTTPELYLSLLSGRHEQRHNDAGSRLSGHPFPKDPHQLMDLLDALAAVCIRKEKGEVFFVSLAMAMDPKAATLYVSSNESVPATVISHLYKIWGQLKELQKAVEPSPLSIPADNKTLSNPNKTLSHMDAIYETTAKSLQANNKDAKFLHLTCLVLKHIQGLLQNDRPPHCLTDLIQTIDRMSVAWWDHLNTAEIDNILTHWDNLIYADWNKKLSL